MLQWLSKRVWGRENGKGEGGNLQQLDTHRHAKPQKIKDGSTFSHFICMRICCLCCCCCCCCSVCVFFFGIMFISTWLELSLLLLLLFFGFSLAAFPFCCARQLPALLMHAAHTHTRTVDTRIHMSTTHTPALHTHTCSTHTLATLYPLHWQIFVDTCRHCHLFYSHKNTNI